MAQVGCHGCVGSSDATHIGMERCSFWLAQAHSGPKLNMPSRTYNITTNHRRRILGTTTGHPARWNDKTLQLYDPLLKGLRDGSILSDVEFELFELDDDGCIIKAKYQGAWVIVDNGYIQWSVTIPPFKEYITQEEIRWSGWIESMRKDVECTFGILKGRFRILKTGIRLHGVEVVDKIWKTCCALHNYLIDVDGLEEGWEDGAQLPWALPDLAQHNPAAPGFRNFAIDRLLSDQQFAAFDPSGMGRGTDSMAQTAQTEEEKEEETINNRGLTFPRGHLGVRVVRDCAFTFFRSRLVEHFDILFKKHLVVWPSRHGSQVQETHSDD
jgi:hypothetical protein